MGVTAEASEKATLATENNTKGRLAREAYGIVAQNIGKTQINNNDAMAKGSALRTQFAKATLLLRRFTAGSGQAHLLRDSSPQSSD